MELVKNIAIIFMSIFFESMPFLLLGALISSIIETYISDETSEEQYVYPCYAYDNGICGETKKYNLNYD